MTYFLIWDILKPTLEIMILWIVIYRILAFFEGTRAFQVLKGLTYLLIAFVLSQILGLDTLNWLLTKFFGISIIAFIIIFQQEIRLGLARLGQQHLFNISLEESEIITIIEDLRSALYRLSQQKIGCLIAIERETKLNTYIESGVLLDSKISKEVILSIFLPQSPIHDGGVILRNDRIVAASCLFPLSENPHFSKTTGTRHLAAVGITEETDAISIIVSEETKEISISHDGKIITIENEDQFMSILKSYLVIKGKKKK